MIFMWYFKTESIRVESFVLIDFAFTVNFKGIIVLTIVNLS